MQYYVFNLSNQSNPSILFFKLLIFLEQMIRIFILMIVQKKVFYFKYNKYECSNLIFLKRGITYNVYICMY